MNYYQQEVNRLRQLLYEKEYPFAQIERARRFMDQNFSEQIDLKTISREVAISKFHFLRLFKAYYGKTPNQYLTDIRLRHAKKCLCQNSNVAMASYEAGFTSVTTFAGLFKKFTGLTPSQFATLKKQF